MVIIPIDNCRTAGEFRAFYEGLFTDIHYVAKANYLEAKDLTRKFDMVKNFLFNFDDKDELPIANVCDLIVGFKRARVRVDALWANFGVNF